MAVHDYIKSGDFATEKHVPVIETVDTVKAGETFHVTLSVGKDIAHPNTVAVSYTHLWIMFGFIEREQILLKQNVYDLIYVDDDYMTLVFPVIGK